MAESKRPIEIIRGARVIIAKRLGVSEGEVRALGNLGGLGAVRNVDKLTLDSWNDVGLEVGSGGIVETVYETGYTGVRFDPTKKVARPFVYDVPTACLSVK